jgi:hypothetical protein
MDARFKHSGMTSQDNQHQDQKNSVMIMDDRFRHAEMTPQGNQHQDQKKQRHDNG